MKKMLGTALLAAATIGAAGSVRADEGLKVKFSGFGTLGGVVTDSDAVQFRSTVRQTRGATKTLDPGVDSRLGAQMDLQVNETFSAVGQLLALRSEGSERPRVEWLFGQAKVTNDVALRAGRMVMPVFLVSDSRNVGYAAHWLRAPTEVYAVYAPSSFDGVQLQWRPRLGDVNFTVQASAGKQTAKVSLGIAGTLDLHGLRSLNVTAESGNWTWRVGGTVTGGALTSDTLGVLANLRDRFFGTGVQFDDGQWVWMSEYTVRRQSEGGPFNSKSYYVSGGHRFGAWLPYATYAGFVAQGAFFGDKPDGRTTALGVRWDVASNLALKAQWESTLPSLQVIAPPTYDNQRLQVLSLVADFVF